tara:strand:+ start:649 stop:1209 length:561 start_codon:yes stop_codon:yes gene_type:complete
MVNRSSALDINYHIGKNPTNNLIGINFKKTENLNLSQVACWPNTVDKVGTLLAKHLDIPDYSRPNQVFSNKSKVLMRIEPLKWWLLKSDLPLLSTQDGTTLDLSHSYTQIVVSGTHSKIFLNRFLPIDLRKTSFPVNYCASSVIHHVSVKLWRSENEFNLFIPRGFAFSLWEIFLDTASQFGFEVK